MAHPASPRTITYRRTSQRAHLARLFGGDAGLMQHFEVRHVGPICENPEPVVVPWSEMPVHFELVLRQPHGLRSALGPRRRERERAPRAEQPPMTPAAFQDLRRFALGWSQQQVADFFELSLRQVKRWERGQSPIPKYAELALGMRAGDLGIISDAWRDHYIVDGRLCVPGARLALTTGDINVMYYHPQQVRLLEEEIRSLRAECQALKNRLGLFTSANDTADRPPGHQMVNMASAALPGIVDARDQASTGADAEAEEDASDDRQNRRNSKA